MDVDVVMDATWPQLGSALGSLLSLVCSAMETPAPVARQRLTRAREGCIPPSWR